MVINGSERSAGSRREKHTLLRMLWCLWGFASPLWSRGRWQGRRSKKRRQEEGQQWQGGGIRNNVLSSKNPPVSVPTATASSFPVEALTPCFHFMLPRVELACGLSCHGKKYVQPGPRTLTPTTLSPSPAPPPALSSNGLAGFGWNHVESHLLFNLILMTNLFSCQEMMTLLVISAVPVGKIN